MNIDEVGYGAGSGFISGIIATIATAFGFKARMDRHDKEFDEHKKTVMYKDTCIATQTGIQNQIDVLMQGTKAINDKLDILLSRRREDRTG